MVKYSLAMTPTVRRQEWLGAKATGNSRSESQKFPPPLSVKIPENSRYENTAYTSRV